MCFYRRVLCPGAKFWESKSGKQRQKYFICRLSSGSFSSLSLKLLWLGFSLIGLNNIVKFRSKDCVREVIEKFLPPPRPWQTTACQNPSGKGDTPPPPLADKNQKKNSLNSIFRPQNTIIGPTFNKKFLREAIL